jgi:GAF domain-containing protein
LIEDEVLRHPLFRNFSGFSASHPPMRGWLATSIYGAGETMYGLLQLSDKSAGRDFDASDEENVREFAALIGETLDALRGGVHRALTGD